MLNRSLDHSFWISRIGGPRTAKSTDKTRDFKISIFKHLQYSLPSGYVVPSKYVDGFCKKSFQPQKTNIKVPTLLVEQAYRSKIPMNPLKMKDVATIVQYIPDQHKLFYKNILTWPSASSSNNDDEDDELENWISCSCTYLIVHTHAFLYFLNKYFIFLKNNHIYD